MKPKILVADDSATIQKVIGITLANEDFQLIKCVAEVELLDLVKEHKPELVLLDYNLSESKTGYDLISEIRNIHDARVIFLYGTFDTIDEALNKSTQVDGHVVKPFDAKKFINLCRDVLTLPVHELSPDFDDEYNDEEGEDFSNNFDSVETDPDKTDQFELGDDWQVNQPNLEDDIEPEDVITSQEKNQLEAGIEDWGIPVPGVIDRDDSHAMDLPPVIEAKSEVAIPEKIQEEAQDAIPSDSDLEYPDITQVVKTVEIEEDFLDVSDDGPQLVSMDELNEVEVPDDGIELTATAGTDTIEGVQALEEQIADETDSEEDLWSADEVMEDPDAHNFYDETEEVEAPITDEPTRREFDITPEATKPINVEAGDKTDPMLSLMTPAMIEAKVRESMQPIIEKIVREEAQKIIEKVAWEVIPDLAENIIKEQLERLADDVFAEE